MKSKILVMFFTFVVLIAVTPLIFSKLMNKKFNQMLDNLRNEGVSIKLVKDKSTYLKTDKIFEVKIPGKLLNSENLAEEYDLIVETQFKNLPVTNVVFKGGVKNVLLNPKYKNIQKDVSEFMSKNVKFFVTTPNFKTYAYSFKDIHIKNSADFSIKGMKGIFTYENGSVKNSLSITGVVLKIKKDFVEIKNFKNEYTFIKGVSSSKVSFNLDGNVNNTSFGIKNVTFKSSVAFGKILKAVSSSYFKTLEIHNLIKADTFNTEIKINGIQTKLLENIALHPQQKNEYIEKIFEKGFNIDLTSALKDVKIVKLGRDLGGYDLSLNIKFMPVKNVIQKLNANDISFIDAKLKFTTTPEIATLLMQAFPKSAFVLALAEKKNNKVTLNIELKHGKLYSKGQLIK